MSFKPDDIFKEMSALDKQEEMIMLLRAIAWLLADQQDENLTQILNNVRNI